MSNWVIYSNTHLRLTVLLDHHARMFDVQLAPVNLAVHVLDRFSNADVEPFAIGAPAGEVSMAWRGAW